MLWREDVKTIPPVDWVCVFLGLYDKKREEEEKKTANTVLFEFAKQCQNLTHINIFGADSWLYVVQELLNKPIFKSQVKNNLTYTYNNHPAS